MDTVVGVGFSVLPRFNVFAVELRHIQIKGTSKIGEGGTYDLFSKNNFKQSVPL